MVQEQDRKTDLSHVYIAVSGHANAGKTSLVRTITKRRFGKVSDKPGMTEHPEPVLNKALQAYFIDCPGFQIANTIYDELQKRSGNVFQKSIDEFMKNPHMFTMLVLLVRYIMQMLVSMLPA